MISPPGPAHGSAPIIRLGIVDSTQARAFDLAARGAPDATVVVADHQTAGRGRRGRTWQDAPGASLLVSIVVRTRLAARDMPWLSYVAAVAVAEALEAAAGLRPRLKWPNDVLVDGRKIAGILLEARLGVPGSGDGAPVTIVGIGINLEPASLPPDLADRATCVRLAAARPVEREALLQAVLTAFRAWRARLEEGEVEPIRQRWLELAETIGRSVEIGDTRGVAAGLDADGALLVDGAGGRRRVMAGELGR